VPLSWFTGSVLTVQRLVRGWDVRGLISCVWWPLLHTGPLGNEGKELGLIPEELHSSSQESNLVCALEPCSGLILNSKHINLFPSGQCIFSTHPPTWVVAPPSIYSPPFPPPFYIQHAWPPSLPGSSTESGQPGLATSRDPPFPTHPKAHSQLTAPPPCNFLAPRFLPPAWC